jgi:RNA polymerase-associated protein CTR9
LENGQYDQAAYLLNGVLSKDAYYIPALFGNIVIMSRKGDIKGCLQAYQTIFRLDPDIPGIRVWIGICFYLLGMTKEARKAFERELTLVGFFL